MLNSMYVVKRDGNQEEVSFDKVLKKRIKSLSEELNVNPASIALLKGLLHH